MRRYYLVAYLLWLFLGFLGAHRFYCRKPVSGLLYLMTAGLLGVGWMVDFFALPFLVAEANEEEPNPSYVLGTAVAGIVLLGGLFSGDRDR